MGKAENEQISIPLDFFFFLIPALAAKAHGYAVGDGFKFTAACKEVKMWCAFLYWHVLCCMPLHIYLESTR